jgi:uncharacterized membrane protein
MTLEIKSKVRTAVLTYINLISPDEKSEIYKNLSSSFVATVQTHSKSDKTAAAAERIAKLREQHEKEISAVEEALLLFAPDEQEILIESIIENSAPKRSNYLNDRKMQAYKKILVENIAKNLGY